MVSLTDARMPTTKLIVTNNTDKAVVGIYVRNSTDIIVIGHRTAALMMTLRSHR